MAPGDLVDIYQRPLTEEEYEDRAVLLELLRDFEDCQDWRVRFISDGFECERRIKK